MKKLVLIIFILLICHKINAQSLNNLEAIEWEQSKYFKKLKLKTYHFNTCNLFESNQYISILEIPKNSKLKFTLAYQNQQLIYLDSFISINNAIAGINGTFFDTKNGGSVDYIRVNRTLINKNFTPKTGLRPDHQKGAILINDGQINLVQWNGDEHWEDYLNADNVMLSGPMLRINNQNTILSYNYFNLEKAPRSVLAKDTKGNTYLIAIDGRAIEAEGLTIFETQKLMEWLNLTSAINLDGGGSTSLYLKNHQDNGYVNHPSDNKKFDHDGKRKIANAILLVK